MNEFPTATIFFVWYKEHMGLKPKGSFNISSEFIYQKKETKRFLGVIPRVFSIILSLHFTFCTASNTQPHSPKKTNKSQKMACMSAAIVTTNQAKSTTPYIKPKAGLLAILHKIASQNLNTSQPFLIAFKRALPNEPPKWLFALTQILCHECYYYHDRKLDQNETDLRKEIWQNQAKYWSLIRSKWGKGPNIKMNLNNGE